MIKNTIIDNPMINSNEIVVNNVIDIYVNKDIIKKKMNDIQLY